MHKGATALLWGEPPGFGGVGGTLPPRLSPGRGKRERGRPSHQSLQLLDSPKSYSPKRVKSAFLLAAHTVHTWPVDPEISQQNRPTSQIPAHSPLENGRIELMDVFRKANVFPVAFGHPIGWRVFLGAFLDLINDCPLKLTDGCPLKLTDGRVMIPSP